MNSKIVLIGILLSISSLVYSQKWELLWADEFNYTGLPDSAKWNYEVGFIRGHEAQYYTNKRIENTRVENGNLIIEARKENFLNALYTSGSVNTRYKKEWLYAKVEVKAILPKGVGMWPAIWMLGSNIDKVGWPQSGEIDIMESIGYDPSMIYMTIHTGMFNGSKGTQIGCKTKIENVYDQYHLYKIEWYPDKIDFFVDDIKYFTYPKAGNSKEMWPYNKPEYLLLNVAVGGDWGGLKGIDDAIFPQKMVIDYVRIYQLKD